MRGGRGRDANAGVGEEEQQHFSRPEERQMFPLMAHVLPDHPSICFAIPVSPQER